MTTLSFTTLEGKTSELNQEALLKYAHLRPKGGESAEDFTLRVVAKINQMSEADEANWNALGETCGEEGQEWVNVNNDAASEGSETQPSLLVLEDSTEPEASTEDASAADADEEESSVESVEKTEPRKVARRLNGKPPGGKPKSTKVTTAKAPKAKAEPKVAAKVAKKAPKVGAGRTPVYPDTGIIKLLVKVNPHRPGTTRAKAFDVFKNGMTVAEARKALVKAGKYAPAQLVLQVKRELIAIR